MTPVAEQKMSDEVLVTITVPQEITRRRIQSLLCGWFESPLGSWFRGIKQYVFKDDFRKDDFRKGGKFQDPDDYYHPSQIIPLTEGCSLILEVEDLESANEGSKDFELTREKILDGLKLMAEKSPKHFRDILEENDDAITTDILGQFIVYKEEVFC